jgi:type I restriction enzyme M protein
MSDTVSQGINNIVWQACDTFRGAVDPAQYKDYILVMLFIKYISDLWQEKRALYAAKYQGEQERIERALNRERFVIPAGCTFDDLYLSQDAANLGEVINMALEKIEDKNKSKLENVFRGIDFNSEPNLGESKERNRRLKSLLEDFHRLAVMPSQIGNKDIIGDTYEYLIARFASDAGKKGGEFYTPSEVSMLLAKLLAPKAGNKICDPACGSGSLLIRVAKEIGSENFSLFGQESNGSTWALCRMNMFLHEMDNARIEWCNTITNPKLIEGDTLMRFHIVVANPPFSLDKWGAETAENDRWKRFWRGIPPKAKGDYAFISHMVEIAFEGEGKVGVIVPHGVLFRGGAEGKIRAKLVAENLLEAVIGLPPALFYGTGIPAAILLFNKGKKNSDILFIDASREFADGKKQNHLRPADIEKIVATFHKFQSVSRYAYCAKLEEVKGNDFNLNISRYVDTQEQEEAIVIADVQKEIAQLENELGEVRKEMDGYLKELGM